MAFSQAVSIRAKKLGVLIRDARVAAGKSKKECAQMIHVSPSTFGAYERGTKSPSLPELEVLAYFFNVPLTHFWGKDARSGDIHPAKKLDLERLFTLRQRIIGALLRQAREEAGLSLKKLSEDTNISSRRIRGFELGERPIAFPELEVIIRALGRPLEDFLDDQSPVGGWMLEQRAIQEFLKLPPDIQAFVCMPINRPYLDIAVRMSEMSADRLRSVAETLLDITL